MAKKKDAGTGFATALKRLREEAGLSQAALEVECTAFCVSRSTSARTRNSIQGR